ncbi:aspartate kinase [Litorivicinus lipolyticus]|uniref:Aspartokinase n=1 Tax=Litorivicinus lipolyticus TaxID=418701 RepID=A0A5Q2QBK7_9GAMM|nr:aspartate kinase [Litorivicinus lipolyticus]QGG80673.1 aspartate kinase [Litorivicinus lipolyticus]
MALIVQKFGGTSVGTVDKIKAIAEKVQKFRSAGHQIVVVVSAMSGETNRLVALADEMQARPDAAEYDTIVSTGEQVTMALLSMALKERGCDARSFTGWQLGMHTDHSHAKARIKRIDETPIRTALDAGQVAVVAGFQGITDDNRISTLGRGGSDTTAVAIAAALKADECQIYTDVDGVYTTDPRVVDSARRMETITFEEMLELASLGSKVLQIRSVEFAGKYKVPLRVLHAFEDGPGTLITVEDHNQMESPVISGIAFNRDEAKVTLLGVPDVPGVAAAILAPVGDANIEVDMVVQNVGENNTTDFTFTVHKNDYERAMELLESVRVSLNARELRGDNAICKVSVVGVGMRSHAGVASTMFKTLASESINIQMISTSEIKISVVIEEKYLELATRALHSAFDLAAV